MRHKKSLVVCILVCIIGISSCFYLCDSYPASPLAIDLIMEPSEINVQQLDHGVISFEPSEIKAGLIFYPGGKVEAEAYAPLLYRLAQKGFVCLLAEMPFNLAVFDVNAADGLQDLYPNVENWYIGGHSLGGSMAASYLEKHPESYKGLILLAAYSTADLSDTSLQVLSIYGSNDRILNLEKYTSYKKNLPDTLSEYRIAGGNHAYFGAYGLQEGDGIATISNEMQIELTTDFIVRNLKIGS